MNVSYVVIIEKIDTGYSAYVPDPPECITVGSTLEETKANMQETISFHLDGMQEDVYEF